MDGIYLLISEGIVLEEFESPDAAMEFKDFMSRGHPEKSYELITDG